MITKTIYFRPDKHLVNNEDLVDQYACLIKDEFTTAESNITVPAYITVCQHYVPKICWKSAKPKQTQKSLSSNHFLEKICFHLVGSKQAPRLTEISSNLCNIDRIEFKGHIGYEQPVFEIISQLPGLRKVSFLINPCKQKSFIPDVGANNVKKMIDEVPTKCLSSNPLVTNVNIAFEKCSTNSCHDFCERSKIKEICYQTCSGDYGTEANLDDSDTKENLRMMIICILQRIVMQCPNIKRLYIDVPNYEGLRNIVENSMKKLFHLKPSVVSSSSSNITVRKSTEIEVLPVRENSNSTSEIKMTLDDDHGASVHELKAEPEPEINLNNGEDDKNDSKSHIGIDEPDSTPCLLDMSKLLGSMLGIPTSSLPSGPILSQLPNNSSAGSSQSGTNGVSSNSIESQNLNDSQPQNSTSAMVTTTTTEHTITTSTDCSVSTTANSSQCITTLSSSLSGEVVITYAAAAASAAATAINTTASTPTSYNNHRQHHHHPNYNRAGGNDIGGHHHHRYHHINEGSRRAFVRDGEGSSVDGEESTKTRNKTKNSIPSHAADLGKPVYVSSASCKSPHKRGV